MVRYTCNELPAGFVIKNNKKVVSYLMTETKTVTKSRTIADQFTQAQEMLAGIAAHTEELSKRGIDTMFIADMTSHYNNTLDAHNNALACKARWLEKTAEFRKYQGKLYDSYSLARKQVKIELPLETWREFGITDRR